MAEYKVILNPVSNKGVSKEIVAEVEEELKKYGIDYDLVLTEYPWHAAELARQAVADGYKYVVAAGGDGTANEVVNGMMMARRNDNNHAVMGVLPIGRGNDFNYSMGNPDDWRESCRVLADKHTKTVDVGFVIGGKYPEGRYFGNGLGIGYDAVVGFIAAKQPIRGFLGYLVAAFRTMYVYSPAPVLEMTHDGGTITQPALMISTMNGIRAGGGFMVAPSSDPTDGVFDVCVADEVPKRKIFPLLIKFIQGAQVGNPAVNYIRSRNLHIRAIKGVIPAHVDGETLCTDGDELEIELLPAHLELLTPEKKEVGS